MKKVAFVGDVHLTDSPPKCRKDDDYLGNLMKKVRFILDRSDAIFFLGDLFKTPTVSDSAKCRIMAMFREYSNKKIYSIIGNHDVPYLNRSLLYKTSLGLMEINDIVEVVTEGINLFGIHIGVIPFQKNIECPKDAEIILGHCFYENELDPEFSVSSSMLKDDKCKFMILGHDHAPSPEREINGFKLLRPGSLCRDNSKEYNLDEFGTRVGFIEMEIDEKKCKIVSHKRTPIPGVLPPREVFFTEVFNINSKTGNKFAHLYDISALLDKYKGRNESVGKKSGGSESSITILQVLGEMKAPPEVVGYIKEMYLNLGMVLR